MKMEVLPQGGKIRDPYESKFILGKYVPDQFYCLEK